MRRVSWYISRRKRKQVMKTIALILESNREYGRELLIRVSSIIVRYKQKGAPIPYGNLPS